MTDEKKLLSSKVSQDLSSSDHVSRMLSTFSSGLTANRITTSTKERIGKIILLVFIVMMLMLFSIPIIIHIYQAVDSTDVNHSCFPKTKSDSKTCDKLPWATDNLTMCSNNSEIYTGKETCRQSLQMFQDCAIGQQNDFYVHTNLQLSQDVDSIIEYLEYASSVECASAAIPFICLYVYNLCNTSDGVTLLPSSEECLYIKTVACGQEWIEASHVFPNLLPNCADLPNQMHPINQTHSIPIITSNTSAITCKDEFYELNDTCLPRCDKFKQESDSVSMWMGIVVAWTGFFGFTMSVVVLILSIIRYKSMFTFPSVFLIYMTISYSIVVLFVSISIFDRTGLYCSSRDLVGSIENPTKFCTVSGVVFHYCLVNATLWWFIHVSIIFYKLVFPFRAKRIEKYEKYIHIVLVVLGLLLPSPAVIYNLATSKYILATFPPLLCLPENGSLWYYSTILVINVLTGTGVCMLISMFRIIYKHRGIAHKGLLTTPEKKIVVVLIYYAVFGFITMVYFGIVTFEQPKFYSALQDYFECELFGNTRNCSQCYRKYTSPSIKAVSYIVMSLIPVVNLVFVINWRKVGMFIDEVKEKCCISVIARRTKIDGDCYNSAFDPHSESSVNN